MSDISETSYWLKFFTDAGIPPSDATEYAITFTDNRIKEPMIPELNKEYLKDMGISVMGDIIAILKHSKIISHKLTRQKAFSSPAVGTTGTTVNLQSSTSQNANQEAPMTKKSSAATRMLEHYVRKEPPPPSPPSSSSSTASSSNLSPSLSARLGGTKRSIEEEDVHQSNKRSSVFNRLGDNAVSSTTSDSPKITITMLGKDKIKTNPESSSKTIKLSSDDVDKSRLKIQPTGKSLQYHGILKYSAKELASKKEKEKAAKSISSPFVKLSKADTTLGIRNRLGASSKPLSISEGIFAHELRDVRKKSSKPYPMEDKVNYNNDIFEGPKVIKKIVKINKKTGHIVSEQKKEIRSNVFKRLQ